MAKGEYRELTDEVVEPMFGLTFSVTIGYYPVAGDEPSIESYELEGDNVSREELVQRFGEDQIKRMETELV